MINDKYRIKEYQNDNLRAYFEENALLFPVETIIGTKFIHNF